MKKQFEMATVMVAIIVLSVLTAMPVMSGNENITNMNKTNGDSSAKYISDEKGKIISGTIANETNVSERELSISIAATSDLVGKIAFTSDRAGVPGIFVMNADGSNVVQLTSDGDWEPAWSPDGKKIAFDSNRAGVPGIFVMNADGSNVVQLTSDGGWGPAWSPDGKKIAFASDWNSDDDNEIYIMNADGSNVSQLISEGYCEPAWSPDGKKIVFASDWDSDYPGIYVMNADGSNVVQLASDGDGPAWSPDGKKIAFSSDSDNPGIYVMNADGSNVVQLTNEPDWEPAWSPDGKKIAFTSVRDGDPEIYVMNADGSNVVQLTINTALDCLPDWYLLLDDSFIPWIYDTNENSIIERYEASIAAKDYIDGKITKEQALEVLLLHFATQP